MKKQFGNKPLGSQQFPMGNPLANVLVVIVGTLVMAASLILGVVAFIALAGLVLVLAAVIGIRVWWLKRKWGKQYGAAVNVHKGQSGHIEIIEGEYQVVSRPDDENSAPKT